MRLLHFSIHFKLQALSMLASCEESTSLARALSHLTETEEGVSMLWSKQADQDTIKLVLGRYHNNLFVQIYRSSFGICWASWLIEGCFP